MQIKPALSNIWREKLGPALDLQMQPEGVKTRYAYLTRSDFQS